MKGGFSIFTKWKADLWAKMRRYGVKQKELAEHLGYTEEYVSMVLNDKKNPKQAKEVFTKGVDELIVQRKADK